MNMVYNKATGSMEKAGRVTPTSIERIAIDGATAAKLVAFAQADGYDLTGISYVTEKDKDGKTKKDKDGNPVFVMVEGKKKVIVIPVSVAKSHSAVADYVAVAIEQFITNREKLQAPTE